jgi:hypothetical protein
MLQRRSTFLGIMISATCYTYSWISVHVQDRVNVQAFSLVIANSRLRELLPLRQNTITWVERRL